MVIHQGKYYTIFDASPSPGARVGFAVAANEVTESDEIILMQGPIRKARAARDQVMWDPGISGIRRGEEAA